MRWLLSSTGGEFSRGDLGIIPEAMTPAPVSDPPVIVRLVPLPSFRLPLTAVVPPVCFSPFAMVMVEPASTNRPPPLMKVFGLMLRLLPFEAWMVPVLLMVVRPLPLVPRVVLPVKLGLIVAAVLSVELPDVLVVVVPKLPMRPEKVEPLPSV